MSCVNPCEKNCRFICGKGYISKATLSKIKSAYKVLQNSSSNSLLKKHLSEEVFNLLKDVETPTGSTLLDVIQSGVENLDSSIGVYAPDREAYTVYKELFDPIIEEIHGFGVNDKHPGSNWGNPGDLRKIDPFGYYVMNTRVRCVRSLDGFPFVPKLTEKQLLQLERMIVEVLKTFGGEHAGEYQHLSTMPKEEQDKLVEAKLIFKDRDKFLESANANCHWPMGRGVFYNADKTFLVWICKEDHLRLISMQPGGGLVKVYKRLMDAVEKLHKEIFFSRHERLGYLTLSPTNLGSTIRASVQINLPLLSENEQKLMEIAKELNLYVKPIRKRVDTRSWRFSSSLGTSPQPGTTYIISNKRKLGVTEFQATKELADGIRKILSLERSMVSSSSL